MDAARASDGKFTVYDVVSRLTGDVEGGGTGAEPLALAQVDAGMID